MKLELMQPLKITIPIFPPSINTSYEIRPSHVRGGKLRMGIGLRADIRRWVSDAQMMMPGTVELDPEMIYSLVINLYTNWLTQEGKIRRKDCGNYEKFIVDALFNRYHIDDSLLWWRLIKKIHSPGEEKVVLVLTPIGTINDMGVTKD